VGEALFDEPRSKAGCDVRIEPYERAVPQCQKTGDESLGIVGIAGDHGANDLAASEWTERGKAGESPGTFEHREAADLGEMGDEITPICAVGDAVELGDGRKIGGPGRAGRTPPEAATNRAKP
jgi:hypothetical protein